MLSSIRGYLLQGRPPRASTSSGALMNNGSWPWPLCSLAQAALCFSLLPQVVWAQNAAAKPSVIEQLMPLAFIFLIFYFLLIRPQQKRHKKHQEFLKQMKVGDKVLTSGGVFGTVGGITDQFVVLEVSAGVKIRILRSSISSGVRE